MKTTLLLFCSALALCVRAGAVTLTIVAVGTDWYEVSRSAN